MHDRKATNTQGINVFGRIRKGNIKNGKRREESGEEHLAIDIAFKLFLIKVDWKLWRRKEVP